MMKSLRIAVILNPQSHFDHKFLFPLHKFTIMNQGCSPQQFGFVRPYDIIIVDNEQAQSDVLETISRLRNSFSQAKIITVCTQPNTDQARELMRLGVTGILLRDELNDGFEHFIQAVHLGRIVVSPIILKQLILTDELLPT